MRRIRKVDNFVPPFELPGLEPEFLETFQDEVCWRGLLTPDLILYRYGSTREQATTSQRLWVNFSEDCFNTSAEVIQKLCLLDFTSSSLGEFDPVSRDPLPSAVFASGWIQEADDEPRPWNTAAWRAAFRVVRELYAWVGLAGSMGFDVFTGKRYRGFGDQIPHISRPGGGSQILVHQSNVSRLDYFQIDEIERVIYPI